MKNNLSIIKTTLVTVIASAFCMQACNKNSVEKFHKKNNGTECHKTPDINTAAGPRLPVAYIRTDSLLNNYRFCIDLNESLMKEIEEQRLKHGQRQQKFQKEVEEFQRKLQHNAYLTQERATQEQRRLEKQQEELAQLAATIQEDFAQKQATIQQQLQDTILNQIKLFNTPQKYEMIFSNIGSDNLFYIDESYNITREVLNFLNARYEPANK
jgi:outer membrane protein